MEDHFLFMLDADDPRGLCLADCCDEGRGVALSEWIDFGRSLPSGAFLGVLTYGFDGRRLFWPKSVQIYNERCTVEHVWSGHLKIDITKVLMDNGSLMKVEKIAECSTWSILQFFWPALSDNRHWKGGSVDEWLLHWTTKLATRVLFSVAAGLSTNYFSAGW